MPDDTFTPHCPSHISERSPSMTTATAHCLGSCSLQPWNLKAEFNICKTQFWTWAANMLQPTKVCKCHCQILWSQNRQILPQFPGRGQVNILYVSDTDLWVLKTRMYILKLRTLTIKGCVRVSVCLYVMSYHFIISSFLM